MSCGFIKKLPVRPCGGLLVFRLRAQNLSLQTTSAGAITTDHPPSDQQAAGLRDRPLRCRTSCILISRTRCSAHRQKHDPPMAFKADRLVIGLDSSTQSTKAILWDRAGRLMAKGSAPISLSNPAGSIRAGSGRVVAVLCVALGSCLKQVDASRIDAMAIVHQRETGRFSTNAQNPFTRRWSG